MIMLYFSTDKTQEISIAFFFMVYVKHDFKQILQIKIQIRDRAELEYIWL